MMSDFLMNTYARLPVAFTHGEGAWLFDEAGKRYLDFTSGIGVNALGHGSPVVRRAIERGLDTGLIHVSNLFRTAPAGALAEFLTDNEISGAPVEDAGVMRIDGEYVAAERGQIFEQDPPDGAGALARTDHGYRSRLEDCVEITNRHCEG